MHERRFAALSSVIIICEHRMFDVTVLLAFPAVTNAFHINASQDPFAIYKLIIS